MKTVKLEFWGYTWESFKGQIPDSSYIYLIYRGYLDSEGFVKMSQLLYIDYAIMTELYESTMMSQIKKNLSSTDMLFFSYAKVDEDIALDVRNLLINRIPTPYNQAIPSPNNLVIETSGNCEFVPHNI